MKFAVLVFALALPGCKVFGADDCPTKLDLCERKLRVCETQLADPTEPIWLGDVPIFRDEPTGD